MRLEFKIAQRKKNGKSKHVTTITDAKIIVSGNKDLVDEIYDDIVKNILNDNRIIY